MDQPSFISLDSFKSFLLPRPREAHKGLYGHVLIIGGNKGMIGAVGLAGEAALRCGAGLVSVATRPEHIVSLTACPEIMVHGIKNSRELKSFFTKATVIVIGPGLGKTRWSLQLMKEILSWPQPKVLDADAINILAQYPEKSEQWILTPHPGEAARLLNCTVEKIQLNRIDSVKQLQKKFGGTIVLKGAHSLICTSHSLSVCEAGNPGMATAGMGDVLSGVIGALLAQKFDTQYAAELGVCLHAAAGDLAAHQLGERGLIATDLMPYLHKLINP